MIKNAFFLGLTTALMSALACFVYSEMYYSIVIDYSEGLGLSKILGYCGAAGMIGFALYFGLSKIVKKPFLVDFIFNFLISMASLAAVFVVLKADDPVFKNGDAQFMVEFYKGFVMPMLFFPPLIWMTFKPLFIRR